jgi:pyridoxal biosynthesis lyase PdxS
MFAVSQFETATIAAIVQPHVARAATHCQDPKVLLEVSEDLTGAMKGLAVSALDEAQMLQTRGW